MRNVHTYLSPQELTNLNEATFHLLWALLTAGRSADDALMRFMIRFEFCKHSDFDYDFRVYRISETAATRETVCSDRIGSFVHGVQGMRPDKFIELLFSSVRLAMVQAMPEWVWGMMQIIDHTGGREGSDNPSWAFSFCETDLVREAARKK